MTGETAPGGLLGNHGVPWGGHFAGIPPSEFFFVDADGDPWPVCQFDPERGDRSLIGVGEVQLA